MKFQESDIIYCLVALVALVCLAIGQQDRNLFSDGTSKNPERDALVANLKKKIRIQSKELKNLQTTVTREEAENEMSSKHQLTSATTGYAVNETLLRDTFIEFGLNFTEVPAHVPWRDIRREGQAVLHNWSYVASEVEQTGHRYCSLYRDNWSCVGDRYKKVLSATPLFDSSYNLNALPANSTIYLEGNSFFSQLVMTFICNTDNIRVWYLGMGNSVLVKSIRTGTTLLLISNCPIQLDPVMTAALLMAIDFIPDIIVRGDVNLDEVTKRKLVRKHAKVYQEKFGGTIYFPFYGRRLPSTCQAGFHNCAFGVGHECTPGPINSYSEDLMRHIILSMSSGFPSLDWLSEQQQQS